MQQLRNNVIRAGLEALYFSGAHHVLRPLLAGVGTILMLHNVRPARVAAFQPNRHLEITPDFLRVTLQYLRDREIEIVSIDEVHRRLSERQFSRPFTCITLDDGYRDNRDSALPVFQEFKAPFTVYVTTDFANGSGRLWWIALERVVARAERIEVTIDGTAVRLETGTPAGKQAAFHRLHGWLRRLPEPQLRAAMTALCDAHGIDESGICRELCLDWDELKAFAADPLVTIGAHSITHCNLAQQSPALAEHEMGISRARIESRLQRPALHLAYPYGDRFAAGPREFALARSIGFKTAVTTRPGMIFAENAAHMMALPRVSLNGNYQQRRILPVLTSGAATAMYNGFRRIDAA